jgi:NET1-associated nuclear protein 1 (U3 small nucleolar RNA-associated protein 17)
LDSHKGGITAVVLNPNHPFQLITASMDGYIRVWDYLDAVLLQTIDVEQPILQMAAHEKFKDHVFVAVSRPTKKKNSNGVLFDCYHVLFSSVL